MEALLDNCRLYVCKNKECKFFPTFKEYDEWMRNPDSKKERKNSIFQPVCTPVYLEAFDTLVLAMRKNGGHVVSALQQE